MIAFLSNLVKKLQLKTAICLGFCVSRLSQIAHIGRGQVIGGRFILAICPNAIEIMCQNKKTIFISATNGKSTTTKFIATILKQAGKQIATNFTGANMPSGVAFALATAKYKNKKKPFEYAVLEVDEQYLPSLSKQCKPIGMVLMNLSRDQLDRGSEVSMLANKWVDAFSKIDFNCYLIANASDPVITFCVEKGSGTLSGPKNKFIKTVWVNAGQRWTQDSKLCLVCGSTISRQQDNDDWYCTGNKEKDKKNSKEKCNFVMPNSAWGVVQGENSKIILPNGGILNLELNLPGKFNVGNACMAIAATNEVFRINPINAKEALKGIDSVDGRYIEKNINGINTRLFLGKNPSSWSEMLELNLSEQIITVLNAKSADGKDTSWIWDVPFEKLRSKKLVVSGKRKYDLATRLEIAGVKNILVIDSPLDYFNSKEIDNNTSKQVDIIANYTAFTALAKEIKTYTTPSQANATKGQGNGK